jgi:hypothetical protein
VILGTVENACSHRVTLGCRKFVEQRQRPSTINREFLDT